MPRSLFMPIARHDLLSLVSRQDKIANIAKDVAGLMTGRAFAFPKSLEADVTSFVNAVIAAAAATETLLNELDELLETGFAGPELDIVKDCIVNLDRLEDDADKLEIKLRAALKAIESELPPIDAMFLYRAIALIGTLADQAQKVGDQLYIITAR
jgi:predicted phosphate transport protein (TIGR00153 family)